MEPFIDAKSCFIVSMVELMHIFVEIYAASVANGNLALHKKCVESLVAFAANAAYFAA